MVANNIDWEKRQSEVISAMRFPLIVLVVFIHTLPNYIPTIELSLSGKCAYSIVSEFFSHNVARLCVPTFFVISGYFFFSNIEEFNFCRYCEKLKTRLRSLLLPYSLWNTIALLSGIALAALSHLLSIQTDIDGQTHTSLYQAFWGLPADYPLWYIRDLMCMVLLTPVFFVFFKFFKYYGILTLWLIYVLCLESKVPGFSSTAILYFGIGAYLGIRKVNMLEIFHRVRTPAYVLSIILLILATCFNGRTSQEYLLRCFIPLGIISVFNLAYWITSKNEILKAKLISLSTAAFFVYALHAVLIINWAKGFVSKLPLPDNGWGLLVSYFLIPIITVCVCLVAYYLLNWLMPSLVRIATGGRAKLKIEIQ